MSKLDFNDDSEKALVEQVFGNAMESLADEDRQLPQVDSKIFLSSANIARVFMVKLTLLCFMPPAERYFRYRTNDV